MKRVAVLERNQTGNIFYENSSWLKGIDKPKIFLEKVIALVEDAADWGVYGESLTRRPSCDKSKFPFLQAKTFTYLFSVKFPYVFSDN